MHNQKIWDEIAESFNKTRKKPWQQCLDFITTFQTNNVVLDLGCGNGRHLIPTLKKVKTVIGLDLSSKLLQIVHNKLTTNSEPSYLLIHGDAQNLPLKNNTVDKILFIASLHNIQGRKNRIQTLIELKRVLKPEGEALISIWTRWQDNFRNHMLLKLLTKKQTEEFGDIQLYWKQNKLNIPRFYHLYSKKELYSDISSAKLHIKKIDKAKMHSKILPDNYFVLVQK